MDDSGAVPIPGLEKLTETYADAYFADHSLLLVLIREGSGSISHEIVSVSADTVTVRRIVPEAGTCDMAEWLLVIELDTMLDDNSVLAIEFEN